MFAARNNSNQQQQRWQEYVVDGTAARIVRIAPISAFAFEDASRTLLPRTVVQLLCSLALIKQIPEEKPNNPKILVGFHGNIRRSPSGYRGVELVLENLVDTRVSGYDDGYNPNFIQFNEHHWNLGNRVGFIEPNKVTDNSRTNSGLINQIPMNRDGAMIADIINRTIEDSRFPVFNELLRKSPRLHHSDRVEFLNELNELEYEVIEPDNDENIRGIIEYLPQILTSHGKSIDAFRSGIESLIADQPDLCNSCLSQLTEAIVLSAGENINQQDLAEDRTVSLLQSIKRLSDLFIDSGYEFSYEYRNIINQTANVETQFTSIEDQLRDAPNLKIALSKLEQNTHYSRVGPGFRNRRPTQTDYEWFRIGTDSEFPVRWADIEGQTSQGIEFTDELTRLYRIRQVHWSIIKKNLNANAKEKTHYAVNNRFQELMNDAYRTITCPHMRRNLLTNQNHEEVRRWILLGAISWYQNEDITPTDKTLEDFLRDVSKALDIDRHEQNSSNEMFPISNHPLLPAQKVGLLN